MSTGGRLFDMQTNYLSSVHWTLYHKLFPFDLPPIVQQYQVKI